MKQHINAGFVLPPYWDIKGQLESKRKMEKSIVFG